jgi:hypothetical protein
VRAGAPGAARVIGIIGGERRSRAVGQEDDEAGLELVYERDP